MRINLSTETEARLATTARAEGVSIEMLVEQLVAERAEVAAIIERSGANAVPVAIDHVRERIERGYAQSERNELVDGEAFVAGLLSDLDETERKRRAG